MLVSELFVALASRRQLHERCLGLFGPRENRELTVTAASVYDFHEFFCLQMTCLGTVRLHPWRIAVLEHINFDDSLLEATDYNTASLHRPCVSRVRLKVCLGSRLKEAAMQDVG